MSMHTKISQEELNKMSALVDAEQARIVQFARGLVGLSMSARDGSDTEGEEPSAAKLIGHINAMVVSADATLQQYGYASEQRQSYREHFSDAVVELLGLDRAHVAEVGKQIREALELPTHQVSDKEKPQERILSMSGRSQAR